MSPWYDDVVGYGVRAVTRAMREVDNRCMVDMRIVLLPVTVVMICMLAIPAVAAPVMELSTNKWDVGEIYQWTNPSTSIGITNKGNEDLKITDVVASCGCTAVFLGEKVIKPGKTVDMRIEFASYLLTGKVNKLVRLTTNAPGSASVDIMVVGFIKDDKASIGSLKPTLVDLGVVAPYETRYIDAEIENSGNIDLNVLGIELPDGFFMDSGTPTMAKVRGSIVVRFGYRPPVDKGLVNAEIRINTSGREGGLLTLKVVGYIAEGARGADTLIVTPTGFRQGAGSFELSLKNAGTSTVTIEGVDSSLDITRQEVSASELKPGDKGTVSMSVDPSGLKPGTKGYIYLRIGIPVEVGGPPK